MRNVGLLLLILLPAFILTGVVPNADEQRNGKVELLADLNGNGKRDRIVRIKYEKPKQLPTAADRTKCQSRTGHFVKYILYRDMQKQGVTIFDYFIGDAEAEYWVYEIKKAADLNGDGRKDLIFYAGDDTTNEHLFLLQNPSYFKAVYTGVMALDEYDLNKANEIVAEPFGAAPKVVAKWNPKREVFEGPQVSWVTSDCVSLRSEPSTESKVLRLLFEGDIVRKSDEANNERSEWQKVKVEYAEGWVHGRYLSVSSPVKQFAIE